MKCSLHELFPEDKDFLYYEPSQTLKSEDKRQKAVGLFIDVYDEFRELLRKVRLLKLEERRPSQIKPKNSKSNFCNFIFFFVY